MCSVDLNNFLPMMWLLQNCRWKRMTVRKYSLVLVCRAASSAVNFSSHSFVGLKSTGVVPERSWFHVSFEHFVTEVGWQVSWDSVEERPCPVSCYNHDLISQPLAHLFIEGMKSRKRVTQTCSKLLLFKATFLSAFKNQTKVLLPKIPRIHQLFIYLVYVLDHQTNHMLPHYNTFKSTSFKVLQFSY